MKPVQILSPTEQLAQYLEAEILNGSLVGDIPGMKSLSATLGVNHKTVDSAMRMLEKKGLILSNGTGKKRSTNAQLTTKRRALKINIMHYEPDDAKLHYMIDVRDKLIQLGHKASFTSKSLVELKMNIPRIQREVKKNPADAWIFQSSGREILEWASQQPFPALAMFGRFRNVAIPATGINKETAVVNALHELHKLGHRKIVMLVQEEQCMPHPGPIPRAFLNALEDLGITSGRYNLPYWQKGSDSFRQCLDALFRHTPPTALLIPEPPLFIAAQQHLARKGIVAPEHISMICHDPSPAFHYCHPSISHFSYDLIPCIQRVLDWIKHIGTGKPDHKQILSESIFVRGGTIGPPAKKVSNK